MYRDAYGDLYENSSLGGYYILDECSNLIYETHVDIEGLGRELGALAKFESLAE